MAVSIKNAVFWGKNSSSYLTGDSRLILCKVLGSHGSDY
jgi:hypothetical protein